MSERISAALLCSGMLPSPTMGSHATMSSPTSEALPREQGRPTLAVIKCFCTRSAGQAGGASTARGADDSLLLAVSSPVGPVNWDPTESKWKLGSVDREGDRDAGGMEFLKLLLDIMLA